MDNPARAAIFRGMDSDLIIVGGGLNGPMMALAAARAGQTSTVIDALPRRTRAADGFDGRAYALSLGTVRMLRALGLWDRLAPNAQPMHKIRVSDGRVGDPCVVLGLDFDSAEIEDGPMGHMVEDRYLRQALLDAMDAEPRITALAETRVVGQSTDAAAAHVTLEDGGTLSGRLLIGADGRGSQTATRAGIGRTGWRYGQWALVCAVEHERPHDGVAHQLFLPAGPLAILPLPGNRSQVVWSEAEGQAKAVTALDDAAYLSVLRPRFGDFLGDIALAGQRYTYPLGLTLAQRFVAPRTVLLGDAAHGMHPIAGQGLNAGMRDVAALAHVIARAARRGEDYAAAPALARYQQWRRFDTAALAAATDTFNRLFSNDNPLLRAARDVGMAAVQATPALRRAFIREAAGLTGDLPELMQG